MFGDLLLWVGKTPKLSLGLLGSRVKSGILTVVVVIVLADFFGLEQEMRIFLSQGIDCFG